VIYLAWSGAWRNCRWRDWIAPLAFLLLIIMAWMVARTRADHSTYFVDRMIREDLLGRSFQNVDAGTQGPWQYTLALFDRFAPWPVFIVAAALMGKRVQFATLPGHARLVLAWALVPLVAFSLAHTQHHWYLDPTYPAWSMLAANAALGLMAAGESQRNRAGLVALILVGVLACEVRVLMRIGITDKRPRNQDFLISMRDHKLVPADETIWAAFALSNSERFILQAVDGYELVESTLTKALTPLGQPKHRVLLLRRRQAAAVVANYSRGRIVSLSPDYVLLSLDSLSATAALSSIAN
jgi:hypothetical protein